MLAAPTLGRHARQTTDPAGYALPSTALPVNSFDEQILRQARVATEPNLTFANPHPCVAIVVGMRLSIIAPCGPVQCRDIVGQVSRQRTLDGAQRAVGEISRAAVPPLWVTSLSEGYGLRMKPTASSRAAQNGIGVRGTNDRADHPSVTPEPIIALEPKGTPQTHPQLAAAEALLLPMRPVPMRRHRPDVQASASAQSSRQRQPSRMISSRRISGFTFVMPSKPSGSLPVMVFWRPKPLERLRRHPSVGRSEILAAGRNPDPRGTEPARPSRHPRRRL